MKMRHPQKQTCCDGKNRYTSRDMAKGVIVYRRKKGIHAYQCPFCFGWHIGH